MDPIDCYITIHAKETDLNLLKRYVGTPIECIEEPGTDTQQLITSRTQRSIYLVWDQSDSILLVNPSHSNSSIRYQLGNDNDKDALASQLSTTKHYGLYLNLPSLHLNESHLKVIRQVIVDAIQDQCSLTVLLNTAIQQPHDGRWSIQTEEQWKEWQTLLGLVYMTQVKVAYAQDAPLFDMTVVILPLLADDYMTRTHFDAVYALDHDTSLLKTWNEKRRVPLTIRPIQASPQKEINNTATEKDHPLQRFDKVVVGGTFDHLHAGHKILLTMTALSSTRAMVVGVTADTMLQSKKHQEWLESTEQRIDQVRQFCEKVRPDLVYDIVPIYDPYGPTITDPTIEALVCSQETLKGGHMVNDERQKRNYSILALRVIDVISATSDCSVVNEENMVDKISSTWIRHYLAQKNRNM